jgi:hypothetical protein
MVSLLVELVAKSNVLAADKYIPFVGTDAPLGIKADAVAVELNVAAAPLSVPVNVGLAENTAEPVPVSSVREVAS